MARARNIKPGFFKNEDLAECSLGARLCFAGLWTLADREGRLEDRPKKIKGELFAYDSIEVDPLLAELAAWDFIRRYEVGGKRFIFITKFLEHQAPHGTEKDGEVPDEEGFVIVNERAKNGYITGKSRREPHSLTVKTGDQSGSLAPTHNGALTVHGGVSGGGENALIPDSGFLIPDSLIPDSLVLIPEAPTELFPPAPSAPSVAKPKKAAVPKADPPISVATWDAYAASYAVRYGVEPVRNQTVNSQLAALVRRLGEDESPAVAGHYVRSNNSRYVACGHGVGTLLQDAEKLRTEWATGRHSTATQAHQADRTQTNLNAFAPLLAEAKRKAVHGEH